MEELLVRGVQPTDLILVSRTPERLDRYSELGASIRFGDFTQPESLDAALSRRGPTSCGRKRGTRARLTSSQPRSCPASSPAGPAYSSLADRSGVRCAQNEERHAQGGDAGDDVLLGVTFTSYTFRSKLHLGRSRARCRLARRGREWAKLHQV